VHPNSVWLSDWKRILLGNAPSGFLLEVLLRTAVVYLLLIVLVRLLGKRMSGQVSTLELGLMIVLGAIVSGAFQVANRGVIPAIVLLFTALLLQRGLSAAGARSVRFERLTQGDAKMVVRGGNLQIDELRTIGISQEQIFSALRAQGIRHLGQLERVYQEASGEFSIFLRQPPSAGLSVLPDWDRELHGRARIAKGSCACAHCGLVQSSSPGPFRCPRCGHHDVQDAVEEPERLGSEATSDPGRHHAA
jgi:uncharacterized membrane protein YcaP (DUF421 family)